jgi:hypothetical protein
MSESSREVIGQRSPKGSAASTGQRAAISAVYSVRSTTGALAAFF